MKFLVSTILISMITGCSSNTIIQNDFGVINNSLKKENVGEIRFIRESALLQRYATLDVFVDGSKKATLKNSSAETITVKPGNHRLEVKLGALDAKSGCGTDLNVSSGEVIYIKASPSSGGAALPIVSIIANPLVCKFNLAAVSQKNGAELYKNITSH